MSAFRDSFQATTDAKGAAMLNIKASTVSLFQGFLTVTAGGAGGNYTLQDRAGNAILGGAGAVAPMGPFRLWPREYAVLAITGAAPSSPVIAALIGDLYRNVDDAPPLTIPSLGGSNPSGTAFPSLSRAVANYNFDVPAQYFARGIVIYLANKAGAGTAGIGYHEVDPITAFDSPILASLNIASGATTAIKIYPGIAVVANQTANNVVVPVPRIVLSVVGSPATCVVTYALLP